MDALLYLTVWISLSLFALAEVARHRTARTWPRAVSAAGLVLMIVHVFIAMGWRHDWAHSSALATTAAQTRDVYGLDWGGGVYVNYVFVVLWTFLVLGCWGDREGAGADRHGAGSEQQGAGGGPAGAGGAGLRHAVVWAVRWVFLIIIANAAVVFAGGWRRLAGAAIVAALVVAWFRTGRLAPGRQPPPAIR